MKALTRASFLVATAAAGGAMLALGRKLRKAPSVPPLPSESLVVAVLPVGQGEACWIRTPDRRFIVIGCGPDGAGETLASSLESAGATRIDLLILPTPYRESLGGVPELLRRLPVTSAYDNGWSEPLNTAHRRAHRFLKEASVPLFAAEAGQAFELGEGRLEVLHPSLPRIDRAPEAGNNSVVLRLRWGQCSFLWAGGMEKAGEEALLARADDVKADWLRVARFGTGHASSPEWLRAVAPEYAVISSAADQDRFPHPETVGRLVAAGVTLFRTDRSDEPLFFFCDGNAITTP